MLERRREGERKEEDRKEEEKVSLKTSIWWAQEKAVWSYLVAIKCRAVTSVGNLNSKTLKTYLFTKMIDTLVQMFIKM